MNNNLILKEHYDSIVKIYHWYCNLYMRRRTTNYPYEREDIFQSACETFLKYYDSTRGRVLPYFVYCIRSTLSSLDKKRRATMRSGYEVSSELTSLDLIAPSTSPELLLDARRRVQTLYKYVKRKYPDHYTSILDRKFFGWTLEELAAKLDTTPKSAKQLTYVCLRDLRDRYDCKDILR